MLALRLSDALFHLMIITGMSIASPADFFGAELKFGGVDEGHHSTPNSFRAEIGSSPNVSYSGAYPSMHKTDLDWDPAEKCNEARINTRSTSRLRRRYHTLVCWLYNLNIPIPDEHFRKGILSVSITDMKCTKFQVNHTESSYSPSDSESKKNDPTLDLKIFGVSATCTGLYHSGLTGGTVTVLIESIPVEFNQANDVSNIEKDLASLPLHLQTSIGSTNIHITDVKGFSKRFSEDAIRAPSSGEITICATNIEVPKENGIEFSGSMSAKIVELFSKSIASHVTEALNSQVCPILKELVDRKLTSLLEKLDDYLKTLFNVGTEYAPGVDLNLKQGRMIKQDEDGLELQRENNDKNISEADFIRWSEVAILRDVLVQGSAFVNRHLNKGLIIDIMERIGWPEINEKHEESCTDCGYFFRGFNGLFRYFTKDNASATIRLDRDFEYHIQSLGRVALSLRNITLGGLDKFTELSLLPQQEHVMKANISMDGLTLAVDIDLVVGLLEGEELNESFTVSLNASDLFLHGDLDFGVVRDVFRDITFGDIQAVQITSCRPWEKLLHTISYAYLPTLLASVTIDMIQVSPLNVQGDAVEESLDILVNRVFDLILTEYKSLVSKSLEAASNGSGRLSLNKFIQGILDQYSDGNNHTIGDTSCTGDFGMIRSEHESFYKFNESTTIDRIHDFFSKDSVINGINNFSSCVTSYLSTAENKNLDGIDKFGISVKDISIGDVEIHSIEALNPIDEEHLEVGVLGNCHPTNISLDFQYPAEELYISCNISSEYVGLRADVGANVLFDVFKFYSLHVYDTLAVPSSLAQPFYISSGLYGFGSGMKKVNVDLDISLIKSGKQKKVSYENGNDRYGRLFTTLFSTSSRVAQNLMNGVKHIYLCLETNTACTEGVKEDDLNEDKGGGIFLHGGSIFIWTTSIVSVALVLNTLFFITKPNMKLDTNMIAGEANAPSVVNSNWIPNSLIFHHKITNGKRVLIPLVIIGTVAIFIISNLSTGASVDVKLSGSDGSTILLIQSATTFSLGKTVRDMYHAQVYTLMSLVLIFSGIWPYIKLILMGVSWFIPLNRCSLARREQILVWLDALGKFKSLNIWRRKSIAEASLTNSFRQILSRRLFRTSSDVGQFQVSHSAN